MILFRLLIVPTLSPIVSDTFKLSLHSVSLSLSLSLKYLLHVTSALSHIEWATESVFYIVAHSHWLYPYHTHTHSHAHIDVCCKYLLSETDVRLSTRMMNQPDIGKWSNNMIRLDAFASCNYHNINNNNGNWNSCATLPHDATRHGTVTVRHGTRHTLHTHRSLEKLSATHGVCLIFPFLCFVNQFSFSHSIWCRLYLPVVFARLSTEWIRDAGSAAIAQKRQPRRSVSVNSDGDSDGDDGEGSNDNSNDDDDDDSNCDSVCERAQRPTDWVKVMMFLAGNGNWWIGSWEWEPGEASLWLVARHGGGGWPQDEPGDDDDDDRLQCWLWLSALAVQTAGDENESAQRERYKHTHRETHAHTERHTHTLAHSLTEQAERSACICIWLP